MDLRDGKDIIASIPVEISVNPFTLQSAPPLPAIFVIIGAIASFLVSAIRQGRNIKALVVNGITNAIDALKRLD